MAEVDSDPANIELTATAAAAPAAAQEPTSTSTTTTDNEKEKKVYLHDDNNDAVPHARQESAGGPKWVFSSPPKTNFFILWFRQLLVMLKTDAILTFLRNWKATVMTIVSPIVFLAILLLLQEVSKDYGNEQNLHPRAYDVPAVSPCFPLVSEACITVMFTPNTAETRSILAVFDRNNRKRLGWEAADFEFTSMTSVKLPEESSFYTAVPNDDFIYDFSIKYPNVTQFAVTFDRQGNDFSYNLWFNQSLASNLTLDVSEIYGISLLGMIRGLDEAIIEVAGAEVGHPKVALNGKVKDWPTRGSPGLSTAIAQRGGPLFYFCSGMINFLLVLNTIVSEKENRLRHGMQMMGLISSVYWTSWFLINTFIIFLSTLVTVGIGHAFSFELFTKTDFGVIFLLFFLFSESMLFFAFFITTLVSKVRVATLVGIFVLIIGLVFMLAVFSSQFVGYIWWEAKTDPAGWIILMFFPPFNFGKLYLDISVLSVGQYSIASDTHTPGPGFFWDDLYKQIPEKYLSPVGDYSLPIPAQSLYFYLMNIAFYGFLCFYCDNVIPDEFGNSRPPYFLFMPSYWGFKGFKKSINLDLDEMRSRAEKEEEDEDVHKERLKALSPESEKEAVRLLYLHKFYSAGLFKPKSAGKVAVAGSCWTLSEGKLLALLGQNGAGKSTTINMLCGFSKATSGDAYIFQQSIRTEMTEIRSMMGVCPQHDILFNNLTAKEHIELFAGIKNLPKSDLKRLTEERLSAVRLLKVQNKQAGTYSGGMKRRLSVAISTIGDPKIVFMDEPTTGMDPVNRRHVWSFIEKFKKGRAIILTTHSMEEADILGDNIAIMALGKLRAFGTSTDLKGKFGAGYRISLVADLQEVPALKEFIAAKIPGSALEDDSAGALVFKIPADSMSHVAEVVRQLENKTLNVREWGISQSTLEEVFLKIIREVNPTNQQ